MNYIQNNKAAWEDAFDHRHPNWGDANADVLLTQTLPFFSNDMILELQKVDFSGKSVAQFCCNNGRELLSLMQLGAQHGVGFDIAENIIGQAKETAKKIGRTDCDFVACNILDITDDYRSRFDFILFTIGAITWFEDLKLLFCKAADCLKPKGIMFIHDFHPFVNMLPMPGEDAFDENRLDKIAYSYFKAEPWIENSGMGYMTPSYESKTFTSYTHTLSDIINSASYAGLTIATFNEYSYDIGMTEVYDHRGYPLSFILTAQKQ